MNNNSFQEKIKSLYSEIVYKFRKNIKKISVAVGILVIAVSLPLAMKFVLNPIEYKKAPAAAPVVMEVTGDNLTLSQSSPSANLKIKIYPLSNQLSFVRASLYFDPTKIKISGTGINTTPLMGRVIDVSDVISANTTGVITLALAVSPPPMLPGESTVIPEGTDLASFTVTLLPTSTTPNESTEIVFFSDTPGSLQNVQVVDVNAINLDKTLKSVRLTLNPSVPTSTSTPSPGTTITPTVNPTNPPAPTSTPAPPTCSFPAVCRQSSCGSGYEQIPGSGCGLGEVCCRPLVTPTPTQLPTTTPGIMTINPTDDTYVSGSNPSTYYSGATVLLVDNSPIYYSYMKFDLSPLAGKTITSAILKMNAKDASQGTQNIKTTLTSDWVGATTNFNNRPVMDGLVTTYEKKSTGAFEVMITSAVQEKAGQVLSLGFDSSNTTDGLDIYSKEYGTVGNRPQLVVNYQ